MKQSENLAAERFNRDPDCLAAAEELVLAQDRFSSAFSELMSHLRRTRGPVELGLGLVEAYVDVLHSARELGRRQGAREDMLQPLSASCFPTR